jgi:hypothetical protein
MKKTRRTWKALVRTALDRATWRDMVAGLRPPGTVKPRNICIFVSQKKLLYKCAGTSLYIFISIFLYRVSNATLIKNKKDTSSSAIVHLCR